jgi:hypothetical protein
MKHFTTDLESTLLKPGEDRVICVTFDAPQEISKKSYDGVIKILSNDEKEPRVITLSGFSEKPTSTVSIDGLDPDSCFNFGDMPLGTNSNYKYGTLSNTGNVGVLVDTIAIKPSGEFHWELMGAREGLNLAQLLPGESRRIRVWFTPRSCSAFAAKLTITFVKNSKLDRGIRLKGNCIMSKSGSRLSTTLLSFLKQPVQTRETKTTILHNAGDLPMELISIEIDGGDKSVFRATCSENWRMSSSGGNLVIPIQARGQVSINVSFAPLKTEESKDILQVKYRVGDSQEPVTETVDLSGTGKPAK